MTRVYCQLNVWFYFYSRLTWCFVLLRGVVCMQQLAITRFGERANAFFTGCLLYIFFATTTHLVRQYAHTSVFTE